MSWGSRVSKPQSGAVAALPAGICSSLCRGLPRAGDFDTAMRIIENARQDLLGDGLLTVNSAGPIVSTGADETIQLQRVWSSRPNEYPVAGHKVKTLTDWTRQLLLRSEVFVGEGTDALATVFDDHRLIRSMGLNAVVNVPLVHADGRCFATFNVLGKNACWSAEDKLLIELLAEFSRPHVAAHVRPLQAACTNV